MTPQDFVSAYSKFRRDLRQLLYDHGVPSNPGWGDEEIVDALRQLLETRDQQSKVPHASQEVPNDLGTN